MDDDDETEKVLFFMVNQRIGFIIDLFYLKKKKKTKNKQIKSKLCEKAFP